MMVSKEEMVNVLKTAAVSRFFFCPGLYLAIGVSSWANSFPGLPCPTNPPTIFYFLSFSYKPSRVSFQGSRKIDKDRKTDRQRDRGREGKGQTPFKKN